MTTLSWPSWLDGVWAKSAEEPGLAGESLALHTWTVLQRLSDATRLRPDLPSRLHMPGLWNILTWACWLHDLGKCAQGFQDMLRGGQKWSNRHEVLSLAFVNWLGSVVPEEELAWVVAAVASHHRDADELLLLYPDPENPEDDPLARRLAEVSDEILGGIWRWLAECMPVWIRSLGLDAAGVKVFDPPLLGEAIREFRHEGATIARRCLRWYGALVRGVSRGQQRALMVATMALRGHIVMSDHTASAHTGALRPVSTRTQDDLILRLGISPGGLFAHQQECARAEGHVVLTAPTGSGKTEAALLWANAQSTDKRPLPRLFYTLPYQASMNAMYDRLTSGAFPSQVGLEHSRSTLALYRRLLFQDYTTSQAAASARLGKQLARLHFYPVRVLSPYQILKGPFRLSGYEALMNDFFGSGFVLDELHAYEPGRLAMILATVKYLREEFGARFLVMSATLPSLLLHRLANALGSYDAIRASHELFWQFRRHRLVMRSGEITAPELLDEVCRSATAGSAVLMCCNTVKKAQEVYTAVKDRLCGASETILLHGRFNASDRISKERLVLEATGSKAAARRPVVLVATQVVEVSLDIDLDTIYTEPAPLEALVQRFGRVNRRRQRRSALVHVCSEPTDGQGVYEPDVIEKTLGVLAQNDGLDIDEEEISEWLDSVYEAAVKTRWENEYDEVYEEFNSGILGMLTAFKSDAGLEQDFYRAFDSVEVLPASMLEIYLGMLVERPLEASELLVPMPWRRFAWLAAKGKARTHQSTRTRVVDLNYDGETGLQLT